SSPREALEQGIATVYQDLAVVPLMPVWSNFFLGNEKRKGPRMDIAFMKKTGKQELLDMGIDLRDVDQPIGTLSGGERQCVAISRAVHFGAKVLILDEPTAALGVKQSGVVLKYIVQARERGLGVIFITHNPHHAYPVGDRLLLLNRGPSIGHYETTEVGYQWLELGPFGYLPSDKARLTDELGRRGLAVAGGTVHGFSGLHRTADWPDIERITRQVSELTAAVGGRHVIFVPVPGYRDDSTGAFLEPAELDAGPWRTMIRAADDLGKMVAEEYP